VTLIGMAVLGLLGCQGVERAATTVVVTTGPPAQSGLTPEERLLRWLKSCDVREILFTEEGVTLVTFRHGRHVRLRIDETAAAKIQETAFRQRCDGFKRVIVGIIIE
jgi:hypothetical protein